MDESNVLITNKGRKITIMSLIQSGGQGSVFKAHDEYGNLFAFKRFNSVFSTIPPFLSNVESLCNQNSLSPAFIWPKEFVNDGEVKGYIMELVEGYLPLSDAIHNEMPFESIESISLDIIRAFRQLHSVGECFSDINEDDILYNPITLDVRICDCDNIAKENIHSKVLGKEGSVAPEVLYEKEPHTMSSDIHSIAVLLFMLLVREHPLRGRLSIDVETDADRMRLYGIEPLFIFDRDDDSNRPLSNATAKYWNELPASIKDLFTRTFELGLYDPDERPGIKEWENVFQANLRTFKSGAVAAPSSKRYLHLLFLVDTSGSMSGERIRAVEERMEWIRTTIKNYIPSKVEPVIDVMTFDDSAAWVGLTPSTLDDFAPVSFKTVPESNTMLDEALYLLDRSLRDTESFMKRPMVPPVIILLTDGNPTYSIQNSMSRLIKNKTFLSSLRIAFMLDESCNPDIMAYFTGDYRSVIKTVDMSIFKDVFRAITLTSSHIASNIIHEDGRLLKSTDTETWATPSSGGYTSTHRQLFSSTRDYFYYGPYRSGGPPIGGAKASLYGV